jgi:hypothetical protein
MPRTKVPLISAPGFVILMSVKRSPTRSVAVLALAGMFLTAGAMAVREKAKVIADL